MLQPRTRVHVRAAGEVPTLMDLEVEVTATRTWRGDLTVVALICNMLACLDLITDLDMHAVCHHVPVKGGENLTVNVVVVFAPST